jgi:hypothetical protein
MSKYQHMNERELVNHIELFGTEDERVILEKLYTGGEPDYDDCPHCERNDSAMDSLRAKVREAINLLEEA